MSASFKSLLTAFAVLALSFSAIATPVAEPVAEPADGVGFGGCPPDC